MCTGTKRYYKFIKGQENELEKFTFFCIEKWLDNNFLSLCIVQGVVKKKRLLYLVGQTRVHCDEVEGLGHFVELEVCSLPLLLLYCT